MTFEMSALWLIWLCSACKIGFWWFKLLSDSSEDFNLKPLDYIHKVSMSLGESEDPGSVEEGARYLEYLAPSLEQLVFTQNKGIMFSNVG